MIFITSDAGLIFSHLIPPNHKNEFLIECTKKSTKQMINPKTNRQYHNIMHTKHNLNLQYFISPILSYHNLGLLPFSIHQHHILDFDSHPYSSRIHNPSSTSKPCMLTMQTKITFLSIKLKNPKWWESETNTMLASHTTAK